MIGQQGPHPDAARSRLRAMVAKVDREIGRRSARADEDAEEKPNALIGAWTALVEQLALGPEPEIRDCPHCGHICMRDATICGHCWKKLPELS